MLDWLDSVLTAIGSAPSPAPLPTGAVGAFWNVDVPLSRLPLNPLPLLFEYARTQQFAAAFAAGLVEGTASIVPPLVPGPDALGVHLQFRCSAFRDTYHKSIELPYPRPALRTLCRGEWTDFGRLTIQAPPNGLLPEIALSGAAGSDAHVRIRWGTPWSAELAATNLWGRLFRRLTRFDLHGFDITHTGARIVASGPPRLFLPSLTWT